MSVPRSRILDLVKTQCKLFGNVFNPEGLRLGTKILRERLKGPSVAAYYPRRLAPLTALKKMYPQYELPDDKEEARTDALYIRRMRGKGAPKKKRTLEESKKFKKKKKPPPGPAFG